jgi:hypothetical protein
MDCRVSRILLALAAATLPFLSVGCGGGAASSSNSVPQSSPQNGTLSMVVSDASTEDWATIGVKVLSIAVTPQGGGSPVNIYTAPSPAPVINLVQLDQLGELIGNASVPAGTYTSATVTISANPGDVLLTAAADPETGFAGTPGEPVPSNQIQIMGATGSAGSLTVPVNVNFVNPLVVTAGQSNALDLEFDLAHPAFLVAHVPATTGTTIWAVNFNGPVRHHRLADLAHLLLRHIYGSNVTVSSDNTSISMMKDYPVEPPTSPETEITSSQSLTILADAKNGTLFYDVDAKTVTTIMNFSSVSFTNKFVRVAARYQPDGSLVAVRIWSSSSFNSVWLSPEGHVLHVNTSTDVITVQNELGAGVPLTVDANTQFFYRTPASAQADATPIGTGTAFLSNLVRGFKVHVSCVDPLASPLVAQTIDIEIARYDGAISASNLMGFTYTRTFFTASDNYTVTLPFISNGTANGADPLTGAAISGFKFWNFTLPTIVTSGAPASIAAFDSATNGSVVTFGGTAAPVVPLGESFAWWNDPAAPNTWAVPWTVLLPSNVPVGLVAAGYNNGTFTMMAPGGTLAVPVDLSTTTGSATLVYQIDRTGSVVTVSVVDITTPAGQNTVTTNLVANTPVKVFGIPQADGSIKGYVVFYYTGMKPSASS